jgi:hypothetical protein
MLYTTTLTNQTAVLGNRVFVVLDQSDVGKYVVHTFDGARSTVDGPIPEMIIVQNNELYELHMRPKAMIIVRDIEGEIITQVDISGDFPGEFTGDTVDYLWNSGMSDQYMYVVAEDGVYIINTYKSDGFSTESRKILDNRGYQIYLGNYNDYHILGGAEGIAVFDMSDDGANIISEVKSEQFEKQVIKNGNILTMDPDGNVTGLSIPDLKEVNVTEKDWYEGGSEYGGSIDAKSGVVSPGRFSTKILGRVGDVIVTKYQILDTNPIKKPEIIGDMKIWYSRDFKLTGKYVIFSSSLFIHAPYEDISQNKRDVFNKYTAKGYTIVFLLDTDDLPRTRGGIVYRQLQRFLGHKHFIVFGSREHRFKDPDDELPSVISILNQTKPITKVLYVHSEDSSHWSTSRIAEVTGMTVVGKDRVFK